MKNWDPRAVSEDLLPRNEEAKRVNISRFTSTLTSY